MQELKGHIQGASYTVELLQIISRWQSVNWDVKLHTQFQTNNKESNHNQTDN